MKLFRWTLLCMTLLTFGAGYAQFPAGPYHERFRPQLHFSPREKWTNDPNGMVYYRGVYHLFYQHYPGDIIWGPMHWGHATSRDLIHWKQQPVALYPDSLGYIFSGCIVVDSANTSGLGEKGRTPLVAVFTHHDPVGEKRGDSTYQNQSLAYSLDQGMTWTKFSGNPVLKNPGIVDFRDPNVMWYKPAKKWVMTLATKDKVTFYSSPDLKSWTKESDFGKDLGAHGGVWECPNLFPMQLGDTTWWVLLLSINPGGPNGGSATQYFVGQFDGKRFYEVGSTIKWIDYGPDDYAGITWAHTGKRKVFLGWMSNWLYANQVPTSTWRNAMTIPRELGLVRVGKEVYIRSMPVKELAAVAGKATVLSDVAVDSMTDISEKLGMQRKSDTATFRLELKADSLRDFFITFSNPLGQQLVVGYQRSSDRWYIDRMLSGKTDFNAVFARKFFAPRLSAGSRLDLTLVMDASSLELFADGGLTVMTVVFFPDTPLTRIHIGTNEPWVMQKVRFTPLRSIW